MKIASGVAGLAAVIALPFAAISFGDNRWHSKSDEAVQEVMASQEFKQLQIDTERNRLTHVRDNCELWASETLEELDWFDELHVMNDGLSMNDQRKVARLETQLADYDSCVAQMTDELQNLK